MRVQPTFRSWVSAGLAAVLVLGLVVSACGGDDEDSGAAAKQDKVELLLSFNLGLVWAPVIAARDAGFFEGQGLDVTLQETDGTSFVTQQLIAGNAEYGFASAAGALIAANEDPDLRVIGCQEQRNIFFINTPTDSGIQSVDDLNGKTVGIGDEASGEGPLMQAIKNENDLDLRILPLGFEPAQVVPALEGGEVVAYAGGITPTTALETSGRIELRDITPEKYDPMPADCLMVKQATLDDPGKREIVVKLLRALSQGARFVRANPDAALDLSCAAAPEQCEGGARERFAEPYMDKVVDVETPIEGDAPFQVNQEGWDVAADVMLEAEVIEQKPDMERFVNSSAVEDIQNEAQDYDVSAVERRARDHEVN
jgi:NitT/TauT family transport system substrate-binding protein